MKKVVYAAGVLLMLGGAVWVLQGVGILPGSFMSGQIQWAYNGAIAILIGLAAVWFARRMK